jgi:hypothetical protein
MRLLTGCITDMPQETGKKIRRRRERLYPVKQECDYEGTDINKENIHV